jgi:2-amino-4-hydroxy-6-hydroxymethyldihydropteridine diphosphokinase
LARIVIGLGSNIGDRLSTLREAVRRIDRQVSSIRARSGVWQTSPIGGPPQDDFFNAAVLIETNESPHAVLRSLMTIENELGRVRTVKDGPRTIDLDILWIEDVTLSDPDLTVPHPRLKERAFALAPLLEVASDAPFSLPNELLERQKVKRTTDL